MPPHGRRRPFPVALFLCLALIFAGTTIATQAVVGIDIGTEYIKAALVKPGVPLDIVLTKDSKRKETAALAFKGTRSRVNTAVDENFPERIYGGDAVALSARFPGDVYPNLKPLLGLSVKDEIATEYSSRRPELQLVESEETGTIGFKSESFVKDEQAFLVEELLAMELKNVRENAENMAGKTFVVHDAVITVPSFYTVQERRAVTTAAELAGLRISSLISDGLAVGLNYATSRTFPVVNEGGKPEVHLIYDMGAGSTTATLVKFQGRTVKDVGRFNKTVQEVQVLGSAWDRSLGGDALNGLIVNDMVEKVVEAPHMKKLELTPKHVKSHGRTMAKLWKEAERIRQVLSANTETQSNMEGLYYEDFNFKYKLKRGDFEKLASKFAARVDTPIQEALETAKLSLSDVESVILHGGAVRTPFVQKELGAAIKDAEKIKTNVNSDEAAVFGAAFKAATISPSFRVKEIRVSDTAAYPVFMSWTLDGKEKQQKIFVPTSQAGAEKQVSFKTTEDFSFNLFQQIALPFKDLPVASITTNNFTDSVKQLNKLGCESADITNHFGIRISPVNGLPEVVSGSVSCEISDTKKSGSVVDGVKDFLGFGSKKEAQEPLKADVDSDTLDSSSSSSSEKDSSSTSEASSSSSSSSSSPSVSPESSSSAAKEPKKKVEKISIGFTTTASGSGGIKSDESLTRIKDRLTAFDASDRSRMLREEALNSLEAYTYKIRDILEDQSFMDVSIPAQRDEIEQKSNDASTWIYGDGADANQATLKARLDELRGLVNPILKRKDEVVKRPEEVQKFRDALLQATSMIELIKGQVAAQASSESEKSASSSSSSSTQSEISENATSATDASETTTAASSDDFADLDDETSTASTSTSTTSTEASSSATPPLANYSQADLDSLAAKEASAKAWLEEKLAAQDKLSLHEPPAVLSTEIAAKNKELGDFVMNLVMRTIKMPKSSSSKKPKATAKKTPKVKSTGPEKATTIDIADMASSASASPSAASDGDSPQDSGAWGSAPTDVKLPFEEMEGLEELSPEDLAAAMESAYASSAAGEAETATAEATSASAGEDKSSKKKAKPTTTKGKERKVKKTKKGKGASSKKKVSKEDHSEL